jgi:hypothetical protein
VMPYASVSMIPDTDIPYNTEAVVKWFYRVARKGILISF